MRTVPDFDLITIDCVVQPTKMGHLFVLDRETGEPLFPVEELPVPPSEIPVEVAFPTQPFPPEEFRLTPQGFGRGDVTGLNPAGNACLTDLAFVCDRFRIVQARWPEGSR